MRRCHRSTAILSGALLLTSAGVALWRTQTATALDHPPHPVAAPPAPAPPGEAAPVAGYRGWTRVNPRPAVMYSRIAALCVSSPRLEAMEAGNPHRDRFITVYVNEAGRHAMLREKRPRFPQGTMIVKEKHPSENSSSPELLTAMRKREPGYDPAGGDWEYMVLDGSAARVLEQGRLSRCQACHRLEQETDYVSRNYLPAELQRQLR